MKWITPKFIREWAQIIRERGWRSFLKEKGWKIVFAIILFYLIRDTIIYIILPYLIFNNFLQ